MEIDHFLTSMEQHQLWKRLITSWWVHTSVSPDLLHSAVFSPKDHQSAAKNGLKCALEGNSVRPEQVLAPHTEINTHRENRDVSAKRGSEAERPIFPRLEILRSHWGGGAHNSSVQSCQPRTSLLNALDQTPRPSVITQTPYCERNVFPPDESLAKWGNIISVWERRAASSLCGPSCDLLPVPGGEEKRKS